ncbi:hypothetical protein [Sinomicrobium sp.]
MESFSFKFQNQKSVRYLIGALLLSFVSIGIVIALDFVNVVVFLSAVFLPMAGGMYFMIKKGKAKDRITLTDSLLNSDHFGRIPYAEIDKIYEANIFTAPPSSLKMRLKSGKKIMWALSDRGSIYNSEEDLRVFFEFKEALSVRLDQFYGTRQQTVSATPETSAETVSSEPVYIEREETPDQQLKKNIAKSKKGTWAIPISLLFGLLALVRTCGDDWFKKDDLDFQKMYRQSQQLHDSYLQQAKKIVRERLKTEGRLFLYTNDAQATLNLLPPIHYSNPTGIKTFEYNNAIDDLRNFVQNPDSVKLNLILMDGYKDARELKGGIWNRSDSGNKALFLRIYDPTHKIKPRYNRQIIDSADYPVLEHIWKAPVYDSIPLDESLKTSFPGFNVLLSLVRHNAPSCKLYMAAREKDGLTEKSFREAVHLLNKVLQDVKADTTAFSLKIIDGTDDFYSE